jgi:hypothetical protein
MDVDQRGDSRETTIFGKTGLEVSKLAFGTWEFSSDWGHADEEAAITMIHRARDLGINFFDTAHQVCGRCTSWCGSCGARQATARSRELRKSGSPKSTVRLEPRPQRY